MWGYAGRRGRRGAQLRPRGHVRRVVKEGAGNPMPYVAVQPVYVELVRMDHGSPYSHVPVQATTDEHGRFDIRGIPKMDRATGYGDSPEQAAQFHFRVLSGDAIFDDRDE